MAVDPDVLEITDDLDRRLSAVEPLTPSDDIQAAHVALPAEGGIIRLGPGVFDQPLNITKHGVTLIGAGYTENSTGYGTVITSTTPLPAGVGVVNVTGRFATLRDVTVDAASLSDYAINVDDPGWASTVVDMGAMGGTVASLRIRQPRCEVRNTETRATAGDCSTLIEGADSMVTNVRCYGGSSAMIVRGGGHQVSGCHSDTAEGQHSLEIDGSHVTVTAHYVGTALEAPLIIRSTTGHRVGVQIKDCLVRNPDVPDLTAPAVLIDTDPSWKIKHLQLSGLQISSGVTQHTFAVSLGANPHRAVGLTVSDSQMYRCVAAWDVEPFAHSGNVIYSDQWGDNPQKVEA